jgi:hypothetical protein
MNDQLERLLTHLKNEIPDARIIADTRLMADALGEETVSAALLDADQYREAGCPEEQIALQVKRGQRLLTAIYPERN